MNKLDKLITHQYGMNQVQQAWEQQDTGNAGKVVLDPWTQPSYQTVTRDALSMDVHEVMVGQSKKFVEQSRYSYRPFAINRWNDVG